VKRGGEDGQEKVSYLTFLCFSKNGPHSRDPHPGVAGGCGDKKRWNQKLLSKKQGRKSEAWLLGKGGKIRSHAQDKKQLGTFIEIGIPKNPGENGKKEAGERSDFNGPKYNIKCNIGVV